MGDFNCPNCHDLKFHFKFARSALQRDTQTLKLIHELKYRRGNHLSQTLAALAAEALLDGRFQVALAEKWPLIPVPLHHKRLQQRRFNQAEEICHFLSQSTHLPTFKALKRIRCTSEQARLHRKERLMNLDKAFAVTTLGERVAMSYRSGVILVDDVFTTGSTTNECAKALRKVGVQCVIVLTVMRG